MDIHLKQYGERGVLAFGLSDAQFRAVQARAKLTPPHGLVEWVEGYDTILLLFADSIRIEEVREWLGSKTGDEIEPCPVPRIHEIPTVYDGPDLDCIADSAACTVEEVIQLHSASLYTVRFMGFSPGFPYLDGLDQRLHFPRRGAPRPRIEAGSVAIGGGHAGIYSIHSPGGWHILGHTDVRLFHTDAAGGMRPDTSSVFLIQPGDQIRFRVIS